jgi:ethanolamine-phosphate cytidylyltransferase
MPPTYDPYSVSKALNIYREIANHEFQKGMGEEVEKLRQELEREQKRKEIEGQFGI